MFLLRDIMSIGPGNPYGWLSKQTETNRNAPDAKPTSQKLRLAMDDELRPGPGNDRRQTAGSHERCSTHIVEYSRALDAFSARLRRQYHRSRGISRGDGTLVQITQTR